MTAAPPGQRGAPEAGEGPRSADRRTATRRLRLAGEPPAAAIAAPFDDPLTPAAFDPEALARRDTRAWQDTLVLSTPPRRAGSDPAHLMLLLLIALVLWLERPDPAPAPTPQAPPSPVAAADTPEAPSLEEARRLDPARAHDALQPEQALLSAAPPREAGGWTELLAAGAFMALAAAVFALVRAHVGPGLALAAAAACLLQVSARAPGGQAFALALATTGFAVVASRGAASAWKAGAVAALVATSTATTPALGAMLLAAWAVEAAISAAWRQALGRLALAMVPLLLARAGAPALGPIAEPLGPPPSSGVLGTLLLVLAIPGAGLLATRGAWVAALAPVALLVGGGAAPALAPIMAPFVALGAAVALDAGGRGLWSRVEPVRRRARATLLRVRAPREADPAPSSSPAAA